MNQRPISFPAQVLSGVYHLVDAADEVLYVGQAANIFRRMVSHPLRGSAAEIRFFPAEVNHLNELEAEHIRRFKPKHNRAGLTHSYIPVLTRRRGFAYQGERYENAEQLLAGKSLVGVGVLKALGLLGSREDLPELCALGFPEPAYCRGARRAWKASRVLAFLSSRTVVA